MLLPKYSFSLDGVSSLDHAVQLQAPIQFPVASRRYDTLEVPGRNGVLHIDTGAYASIETTAKCFVLDAEAGSKLREAVMWLTNGKFRRLETPEDTEAFRLCRILPGFATEVRMGVLAVFDVPITCGPERWLKSGETPVAVSSGQALTNDWMPSKPLIQITGTGAGELRVGGSTITITGMDGVLDIDSDTQNAYSGTENKNSLIEVADGFPVLDTGKTVVTYSGGITAVKIIPRWWTL